MNPCYSDEGFEILFAEAGKSYGALPAHVDQQISWLNEHNALPEKSTVLDIGCYEGDFLTRLPDSVQKIGVDVDRAAIERGRAKSLPGQLELISDKFEHFSLEGEPPGLITMIHVLEHLSDPVGVLKHLRRLAKDSTQLFVEIPILEYGETNDVNGFFSIQHLTHFSKHTIAECLQKSGWTIKFSEEVAEYRAYRILAIADKTQEKFSYSTGSPEDLAAAYRSLHSWFSALIAIEQRISQLPAARKILFWGGGAHLECLFQVTSIFKVFGESEFLLIDTDKAKQGKTWRGIEIMDPSILATMDWKNTELIISSYGSQEIIAEALAAMGVPEKHVHKLYSYISRY